MSETPSRPPAGDYIAPQGYYEKTQAMPFLGRVKCSASVIKAGEWTELLLDYEVGASGLADGAWIKATFKFYSDWALFQTSDPRAANYVSAEYQAGPLLPGQEPASVQSLACRFDQKGHERPFQKAIIVDIVDGYLNPGDHILIRLGDRRHGGPGTRAQTFVEKDFRFRFYIDPVGTSRFAPVPGDIVLQIEPDAPRRLVVTAPRLIQPGADLPCHIRLEDSWGNACRDLSVAVDVRATQGGVEIYRRQAQLASDGWAILRLDDIPTDAAGELVIAARIADGPHADADQAFVTIDPQSPVPRIFYADLHVHSDDTIGTNDTAYNLSYGRDVAGLDVLGYTANDFQITEARWRASVERIREISVDGSFVCYPGTEWCGNSCAGGDHNVVFLSDGEPLFPRGREGESVRSFEWSEDMASNEITPGAWPLDELYAAYAHDPEGHLLIPHVGGRRANLAWHHPELERLIEIGSTWGQFPWMLQDAVARGYHLGASAASDEHRGRCGGGVPGTAVFGVRGGLTGVIADQLDRATIGKALRARKTFATTGERSVALASAGDYWQGEAFAHNGPLRANYRFLGQAGFEEIAAYDHNGCFWRRDLEVEAGLSDHRIRLRWGGARIKDRYRAAQWQGRISIRNGIIRSFRATGFEHQEEAVWSLGPSEIGFRSDTFGDADSIEIDLTGLERCEISVEGTIGGYVKVGDPSKPNPFVHCPSFACKTTGAELFAWRRIDQALGGADLFISLERIPDAPLARDICGVVEIEAENGPHGFRQVYFAGKQADGAKVYTSPMRITFE
ncbi:hypothetical protein [Methylocella silvestris]|uniref:DUF3604 domain-containing protein n=1 Tax=Methylocella silvestris TaxID=199596 RepID=A0A2J7THD3_METSI|nr:hypothetical protein [Methylocella silvestris]PNG26171.1 hypothetical protein CR492_10005 [Methylocella silvestris]